MRPGFDREPDPQVPRLDAGPVVRIQREQLDPLSVDRHLQLVAIGEPGRPVALAGNPAQQIDLDDVVAVLGKGVPDQRPAACAERQPRDSLVLPHLLRHAELARRRRGERPPHRGLADLGGRRQVALHERLVQPEHPGDVVEAVAGIVGREQGSGVDVERQQVADDVRVFRAIQTVKRFRAARVRPRGRCALELALQPREQGIMRRRVRARPPRGRHHPGAQLAQDVLPERRVGAHVRGIDRQQRHRHGAAPVPGVVVAGDAVAIEESPRRAGDGGGRRRGLRGTGRLHTAAGSRCREPARDQDRRPEHGSARLEPLRHGM